MYEFVWLRLVTRLGWLRLQWGFLSPSFARYSRTDFVSEAELAFLKDVAPTSPLQFAAEMSCSDMTCTMSLTVLHIPTVTYSNHIPPVEPRCWTSYGFTMVHPKRLLPPGQPARHDGHEVLALRTCLLQILGSSFEFQLPTTTVCGGGSFQHNVT